MNAIVVFAGPSLTPEDRALYPGTEFRPPAAQGDILRASTAKPRAIGLIDGYFGDRLAVHQKEILHAMAAGIPVAGAASMGALRAAELSIYGMKGVGAIFEAYASGEIGSDADVAVSHGPEDLGLRATSVSMVDVRATARALLRRRSMPAAEVERVLDAASAIFFADRTWTRIAARIHPEGTRYRRLVETLEQSHVQQKRLDAIELLNVLHREPLAAPRFREGPPETTYFRDMRERALTT